MSESQPHPESEGSAMIATDINSKQQENIIENQPSFTELQKSCHLPGEIEEKRHLQQYINRPGPSSQEDLISIAETFNNHAALLSTETLYTEQEGEAQKIENTNTQKIRGERSQEYSNKESPKVLSNEQPTDCIHAPLNKISLTQTTTFQVLQAGNTESIQPADSYKENVENIFTLTHTQQIKIDNKQSKNIQENLNTIPVSPLSDFFHQNSKFKITKTIEQSHIPSAQLNKRQQIPPNGRQPISEEVKQQLKTASPQIKEQNTQKPEPFKLQSLYVSTLRSNTGIKPPQSTTQKKPKIWQMFKNKRENKQVQQAKISSQPPKQPQIVNNNPQNASQTVSIDLNKDSVNNTNQGQMHKQIPIKETIIPQSVQPSKPPQGTQQKNVIKQSPLLLPTFEQKIQRKPLFNDDIQSTTIQFHHSHHHPLERSNLEQIKILQPDRVQNEPQQQNKLPQSEAKNIEQKLQQQDKAPNDQNTQKQKSQQKYIDEQPSQASPSEKQQMIVDYTHNKKYQEELQKINRQKIKQLELKLKNQEEINRELEKSLSLPIKFITSTVVGASTAGIAWIAKKNKNISILLGIATSVATFIFSY